MVKGWDYMRGMPPGGTLVINTHYSPDYMLRFVPGPERLSQLVCVDAAKLADHKWLYYRLGELGLDRLSTEGAAERSKAIAPDIAAPLIAAVVKSTGIVARKGSGPLPHRQLAIHAAGLSRQDAAVQPRVRHQREDPGVSRPRQAWQVSRRLRAHQRRHAVPLGHRTR